MNTMMKIPKRCWTEVVTKLSLLYTVSMWNLEPSYLKEIFSMGKCKIHSNFTWLGKILFLIRRIIFCIFLFNNTVYLVCFEQSAVFGGMLCADCNTVFPPQQIEQISCHSLKQQGMKLLFNTPLWALLTNELYRAIRSPICLKRKLWHGKGNRLTAMFAC